MAQEEIFSGEEQIIQTNDMETVLVKEETDLVQEETVVVQEETNMVQTEETVVVNAVQEETVVVQDMLDHQDVIKQEESNVVVEAVSGHEEVSGGIFLDGEVVTKEEIISTDESAGIQVRHHKHMLW